MASSETWILFVAEPEQPGWENRKLPMGGLTDILEEHWDYSGSEVPQVGDRFRQFLKVPEFVDAEFPESSTHVREGDWVVTQIERYPAASPDPTKKEIVVCYCKFEPILSELRPLSRAKMKAGQIS